MRKNGFNISPVYQNIMERLCRVSIYDCNKNNIDMIFNIPEEASKEKRKTIEELQDVFASGKWVDYNKKVMHLVSLFQLQYVTLFCIHKK